MAESYDHMQGVENDISQHSEQELTSDASSAAAARVRNAVQPTGGRKEGAMTYIPEALAISPMIMGSMIKGIVNR